VNDQVDKKINCWWFLLGFFLTLTFSVSNATDTYQETPLEASQFQHLPEVKEVNHFLGKLAESSPYAIIEQLGLSTDGQPVNMLLVSDDEIFLEGGIATSDKLTVMIIGSQHGNEPSGSEAIQMLIRDILHGEDALLESMNLVLIPIANPDGRDQISRSNGNKVNINSNYIVLDQVEAQLIADTLNRFKPHVIFDVHESSTGGRQLREEEGYLANLGTQFEVATHVDIDADLEAFSTNIFLPDLIAAANHQGLVARQYRGVINSVNQPVGRASLGASRLRNYAGLQGAVSVLVENRVSIKNRDYPTWQDIKRRTETQLSSILVFLQQTQLHREQIFEVTQQAEKNWSSDRNGDTVLMLREGYTIDEKQPTIDIPLIEISTNKQVIKKLPNYQTIVANTPLVLPQAYVVTAEQKLIGDLLRRHYITYDKITVPKQMEGIRQKIQTVEMVTDSNAVTVELVEKDALIDLQKGDLLIKTDQVLGVLIPLLFDPRSSDSIFQDIAYRPLLLKYDEFFISPVKLKSDS